MEGGQGGDRQVSVAALHSALPHRILGVKQRHPRLQERSESDTVIGEPLGDFVTLTEAYSGMHTRDGVFVAAGPGLGQGVAIDPISQLDITPTLLALVDLPAAADMVGTVPLALFTQAPALPESPESYDDIVDRRSFSGGQEGSNEAALWALGYIE